MTPRQLELLDFIKSYTAENRLPPSYRDMAKGMNLVSPSGVHKMVSALERDGYVKRSTEYRGVSLTKKGMLM